MKSFSKGNFVLRFISFELKVRIFQNENMYEVVAISCFFQKFLDPYQRRAVLNLISQGPSSLVDNQGVASRESYYFFSLVCCAPFHFQLHFTKIGSNIVFENKTNFFVHNLGNATTSYIHSEIS